MIKGDLVKVRDFYCGFHSPRSWGLVIDSFTDDDGALWLRVSCPSHPPAWHPDYELELMSTSKPNAGDKKDV